jgi:DNA-binding YbaB/EbfC family protein
MDLFKMAKQMKDMQGEMKKMRAALAAQSVVGEGGRGALKVELTGTMEVKKITLDPKTLEKPNVEQLEKMMEEAFAKALEKAQKLAASQLGKITGGMGGLNPFA